MYKDHFDSNFTWSNFSIEDQAKVLVAPRSNNELDTKKVGARAKVELLQYNPFSVCA